MALTFYKLVEEPVTRTPPHLEPIVPNSGNRLRTKPFASLYPIPSMPTAFVPSSAGKHAASDSTLK